MTHPAAPRILCWRATIPGMSLCGTGGTFGAGSFYPACCSERILHGAIPDAAARFISLPAGGFCYGLAYRYRKKQQPAWYMGSYGLADVNETLAIYYVAPFCVTLAVRASAWTRRAYVGAGSEQHLCRYGIAAACLLAVTMRLAATQRLRALRQMPRWRVRVCQDACLLCVPLTSLWFTSPLAGFGSSCYWTPAVIFAARSSVSLAATAEFTILQATWR